MVRLYGKAPYEVVLVHGGPGAIGSLKGFAEELSQLSRKGVVEALQSKYSIVELVEELYGQIRSYCPGQVSLIGHSWGAWLVSLFAERYPELVKNVVLVGCPPLEDQYISEIGSRRLQNLSDEDGAIFQRLMNNQATDEDLERVPRLLDLTDNYCPVGRERHRADKTDSEMHNKIWDEAAKLRSNGELLTFFKNIKSKIYLIQGEVDPHPARGVILPLQENDIRFDAYILKKCGHSPFMEKYAKDEFYNILIRAIK